MTPLVNSPAFTLLAFIFVLGVVIFIHELGHFIVAKLLRIRVLTFSLGFGPRLTGLRRGGTDYRISALPLGGYVKMAGDEFESATGQVDEFLSRPKTHRFLVAVAGPSMNFVLAILLLAINFNLGVEVPKYLMAPFTVEGLEPNSPAERAGLQAKDKIVKIDGAPVATYDQAALIIQMNPNQKLLLTIDRKGTLIEKEIIPRLIPDQGVGDIGVIPYPDAAHTSVYTVVKGLPAERAGIKKGDEIISVQSRDRVAMGHSQIMDLLSKSEGVPLQFTIRRGVDTVVKEITPTRVKNRVMVGLGFGPPTIVQKYNFSKALAQSIKQNYKATALTFELLGRLIRGSGSRQALIGPIGIAMYSGDAAREGREVFMSFLSLISLNLGTINLLPIPILDGGVIFLLLIEGITRRQLSIRVKERIVQVGFIFIVLLTVVVIVNDITKIPLFNKFFR